MKLAEIDWVVLRGALILLVVALIVSVTLIYGGVHFGEQMSREIGTERRQLTSVRSQYQTIDDEQRVIELYLPQYEVLAERGIVGKEHRLSWVETLKAVAEEVKVPSLRYELYPQEEYVAEFPLRQGVYKVYSSEMRLDMGLLHEGDLPVVLRELQRKATGLFTVSRCQLIRSSQLVTMQPKAKNINASCQLKWYTIEALYGFVLTNGRLPCPETDDATAVGTEDRTAGVCDVAEGLLPWTDLGVAELDSWNNRFRYIVDIHFADDDDGMDILPDGPPSQPHPPPGPGELHSECDGQTETVGVSLRLCSSGHITIFDAEGTYDDPSIPGAPDSNQIAINVPALVISRGANGGLATTDLVSLHEIENTNGDDTFVSRDFTAQGGWEFDDVLIWISPNVLKSKLVTANLLP